MRGADHFPPGEYDGHSTRTILSETSGEHFNHREVETGGGWPSDPRPLWARLGDVVGRAVIVGGFMIALLAFAAWAVERNS